MNHTARHYGWTRRQYGFGGMLMLMIVLALGSVSAILAFYRPGRANELVDQRTAVSLANVKRALIGYAAQRGVAMCSNPGNSTQCQAELLQRPGELPCPDTNNDGLEESSCTTETLGRVPWKTLGIPDPKDSAGETMWYAVAAPFRTKPSNSANINSDTVGNVTVRGADGVTAVTTDAVAVVFAPGLALGTQNRSSTSQALCATTNSTRSRNLCAANYLETAGGTNNAVNAGPYVNAPTTAAFNDRVVFITTAEVMPLVEMRVGNELRALLLQYRQKSLCQCYPWAESWKWSGGIADPGVNRGRFPKDADPEEWGSAGRNPLDPIPTLPQWVGDNDWANHIWYSAARQETDQTGTKCWFCSPNTMLLVDTIPVSALLFTPGPAPVGVDRSNNATARDDLNNYLDDSGNRNARDMSGAVISRGRCLGWDFEVGAQYPVNHDVSTTCDTYVKPSSKAQQRDRLFTLQTSNPQCTVSALALLQKAPCLDPHDPTKVTDVCQALVDGLATCTCSKAAQQLLAVPCRNSLSAYPECNPWVTQLKVC